VLDGVTLNDGLHTGRFEAIVKAAVAVMELRSVI